MCGLVGVVGAVTVKEEGVFKQLLELDTIRGPHSTGVLSVNSNDHSLVKSLGTPWDLYDSKKFTDLMSRQHNMLLGHNRWATRGGISRATAHPFEFENVVGAHNGTLRSVRKLDDNKDFKVDSENLYHHMDRNGLKSTVDNLDGSYALTWLNIQDRTMNFLRNRERDLNYTFSEDGKTLFWASESWMLTVALSKAGIKHDKIYQFEEMLHYELDIPDKTPYQCGALPKFRTRKYEEYVAPVSNFGGYWDKNNGRYLPPKKVTPTTPKPFMEKLVGELISFTGGTGILGNNPHISTEHRFNKAIKIKLFPVYNSNKWDMYIDSNRIFQGRVKSYKDVDGGYLLIDLRSVKEQVPDEGEVVIEEEGQDTYSVMPFRGTQISYQEWERKTAQGCAWCAEAPHPHEAKELLWLDGPDEFVCAGCVEQDEVKQLLNNK